MMVYDECKCLMDALMKQGASRKIPICLNYVSQMTLGIFQESFEDELGMLRECFKDAAIN